MVFGSGFVNGVKNGVKNGVGNFLHSLLTDVHTPHYFNEIALIGDAANKPSGANAKDNMLFYEQDTGLWKRYKVALSAWVLIAPNMHLLGYDYTGLVNKNLAIDPETKALKVEIVGGGDGGVTDHGDLTGLDDPDDHLWVVKKAGDTMTGFLILSGAPTANLHAATKKYVDNQAPGTFNNYKCRAYLGSNQIINRTTYTKINLSATSYDPENCFHSGNKSIDIQVSGDYLICASLWYDYGLTGGTVVMVQVKKNSSIIIEKDDMCPGTTPVGKDVQPFGADICPLSTGDRITLNTKYWGGDSTCELQATYIQNYLTVIRLR